MYYKIRLQNYKFLNKQIYSYSEKILIWPPSWRMTHETKTLQFTVQTNISSLAVTKDICYNFKVYVNLERGGGRDIMDQYT